jgi:5'-nucleotidase (lipoprotein e(P4) family)
VSRLGEAQSETGHGNFALIPTGGAFTGAAMESAARVAPPTPDCLGYEPMRMTVRAFLFPVLVAILAMGCSTPSPQATHRRNVALWATESAEYTAVAIQIYSTAKRRLVDALADPSWTASLEQESDYEDLPTAIIVDLDETVLDNRPFQMGLIRDGAEFNEESWNEWVRTADVGSIPGSVPFLQHAHRLGVEVFYVTNRTHSVEEATRRNLIRLDLPLNDEIDTLLTKHEQPQWTREKEKRREFIRERYRVLLVVGDNLGDFVKEKRFSRGGRRATVVEHAEMWGTKWFMLPNPLYGGWVSATLEESDPAAE